MEGYGLIWKFVSRRWRLTVLRLLLVVLIAKTAKSGELRCLDALHMVHALPDLARARRWVQWVAAICDQVSTASPNAREPGYCVYRQSALLLKPSLQRGSGAQAVRTEKLKMLRVFFDFELFLRRAAGCSVLLCL